MNERFISVVIPTLNSERLLPNCLDSIRMQDYPADKVEIIIADGGSTDRTVEIARMYTDKIYPNPLKTGEAGKAVGLKHASGEIIALIDSDNVLPDRDWFKMMTAPFEDPEIAGTEPLCYTYRKSDGYITRYCAMMGANDPLCIFLGNYDRCSALTNRWTDMPVKEVDRGGYLMIELEEMHLPTIGANGFMVRRDHLERCSIGDYLFDIDVVYELVRQGHTRFAKVKTGIIHIFSGSMYTFVMKQKRRIRDYGYYKNIRRYPWSKLDKSKLLKFVFYTITTLPLLAQVAKGWSKNNDYAWIFHIPACWITLAVYIIGTIQNLLGAKSMARDKWGYW